jgi:mono/diheme cytochrome c family protein
MFKILEDLVLFLLSLFGSRFRLFLTVFALAIVAVVGIAGFRGDHSRKPPIEIFPDMDRQAKLRPQTETRFAAWTDGMTSRQPVPGTVARGSAWEDNEMNTGKKPDASFVDANPVPINAQLLKRGQERFNIYCSPCHGAAGKGDGITKKMGMTTVADLHQERLVKSPDGQIFDTITNGKSTMIGYSAQIPIPDRWAIVAYVRALHLSHLASPNDLPAEVRSKLQ